MIDNIFIGQIKPKNNMKCVVSNKVFGPSTRQKTGYQVVITKDGKKNYFTVYGKAEVDTVVKKAKELEKGE